VRVAPLDELERAWTRLTVSSRFFPGFRSSFKSVTAARNTSNRAGRERAPAPDDRAHRRRFTDFDRRTSRAIVKSANENAASARGFNSDHQPPAWNGGISLAELAGVSPTASSR
jgi:hypothetical protein